MKIEINKDYESEFKKTVWKGLTLRELVTGAAALLASGTTAFFVWKHTGLPVSVCSYIGMPWMLLIGGMGLLRYQGATPKELLGEMLYTWRTRELSGETGMCPEIRPFTMKPGGGRRRTHGSI